MSLRAEFESGAPWHLTCVVEDFGRDLLCRITGGDAHVGAVAVAHWTGARAETQCQVVENHKEDKIALNGAHRLCTAGRRTAVCVAGIHFDGIDRGDIAEISQAAFELTRRACEAVADRRMSEAVSHSELLARIHDGAEEVAGEFERFSTTPWDELVRCHGKEAGAAVQRSFEGRVRIFAPLYLSNACINNCSYCGFRHGISFDRKTLSREQACQEAQVLATRGFRSIDLVTGEIPTDRFVSYLADVTLAILAETEISTINLNVGALSTQQYRTLRDAGATGYHLYQECYDPDVYFRVHESGAKRDMAGRLDGLHRAVAAGFEFVGLGILLGLAEPASELAHLVRHAEVLTGDFDGIRIGFSLPRIQQVDRECSYRPAAAVSDDLFKKATLFLRLRFPQAHLTLTTRETGELRDELLPLGISKLSAEVSTAPGGYAGDEEDTEQFAVADHRSMEEVVRRVEAAGLIPVY